MYAHKFVDTKFYCLSNGGRIVQAQTASQWGLLKNYLDSFVPSLTVSIWLGLQDKNNTNHPDQFLWEDSDQTTKKFAVWGVSQPSSGAQSCVKAYYKKFWNWYDTECINPYSLNIVCQRNFLSSEKTSSQGMGDDLNSYNLIIK